MHPVKLLQESLQLGLAGPNEDQDQCLPCKVGYGEGAPMLLDAVEDEGGGWPAHHGVLGWNEGAGTSAGRVSSQEHQNGRGGEKVEATPHETLQGPGEAPGAAHYKFRAGKASNAGNSPVPKPSPADSLATQQPSLTAAT